MPKISSDDLKAFGVAVKRARSLKGWTLDELGAAIVPPVGKSLISKIEHGTKESLNSRTVGRVINALGLDENWIDTFLDVDTPEDGDETKVEQDADRMLQIIAKDEDAPQLSEELLIQLANTYADNKHHDFQTAYVGLRNALETAKRIKDRGVIDFEPTANVSETKLGFQATLADVQARKLDLTETSIVDFDFDKAKLWLNAVGFTDDIKHLRNPERVRAFLDDIDELREVLQDFTDFAVELRLEGNRNLAVVRSAEKILTELEFAEAGTHLRARRLIELSGYLLSFSLEVDQRTALGETLSNMIDDSVDRLQLLCARHFGPSLEKLQGLKDLELDDEDPDQILVLLGKALIAAKTADGTNLARLDPEAITVLQQMVDDLTVLRGALAEAQSEEQMRHLRSRFARGVGGIAATFGHYVEKGKQYSERSFAGVDTALKHFKRIKGMKEILEALEKILENGGGS